MADDYVLYGAPGSGATVVGAALTLIGLPFRTVDVAPWESEAERARIGAVNPIRQAPALILPSGELMTESAAILIHLADSHPDARLAPPVGSPGRAQFLRWMVYIPAQIYSMFWVRDDPTRLADDEAHQKLILTRTAERIAECWRLMDGQVAPGRYLLGDELSALDLYVAVCSRWTPRRRRFYEVAPKMAEVVRRVDEDPRLAAFWAARMPFEEGWEG